MRIVARKDASNIQWLSLSTQVSFVIFAIRPTKIFFQTDSCPHKCLIYIYATDTQKVYVVCAEMKRHKSQHSLGNQQSTQAEAEDQK